MIDFAGLVGKITGKMPGQTDGSVMVGGEAGVAIGGEFAQLLRHAAQVEAGGAKGNLRLVVDNGAAPVVTGAPVTTMPEGAGVDMASLTGEISPASDDDGDTATEIAFQFTDQSVPMPPQIPVAVVAAGQTPVATTSPGQDIAATATKQAGPATVAGVASQPAMQAQVQAETTLPTFSQAAAAVAAAQEPVSAEPKQPEIMLAAGEAPQPIKPGVLTAAWRMFAPRARSGATTDQPVTTAQTQTLPATDAKSDDAAALSAITGKSSSTTFAGSTDASVALSAPLRSIVEGLPPVIQSELGAPSVRAVAGAVAGPSTGEALGDQVIDMGVSGQWIDRMAQEIAGLADGSGHSRFTLNPPHLGRLQVDLWRDGAETNVRMLTETDEAAQRLSEGRSALQADARVAALSLGAIVVEKSSASFDSSGRDQGGQRQGSDLSGQMQQQQQQAEGQAQNRANNARNNGSDWVSRIARDQPNQQDDAPSRAPSRSANGRVRFA